MILVTGGSGHLGSNLVHRLIAEGERPRVLVHREDRAFHGLDVERVEGDLLDWASVRRAVDGCTKVFHCAARVSTAMRGARETYQVNVGGTRNVLSAARSCGVERVVVTGSLSAIGHVKGRPSREEDPFNPFEKNTPYAVSKHHVERECAAAAAKGLDVVIAVSTAIVGPHDYKPSRMGQLLVDFSTGRLSAYVAGGFEFVCARDIVEGHLLAMERGKAGRKYLFSSGFRTVDQMMRIYSEVTGVPAPRLRVPFPVMAAAAALVDPLAGRLVPDDKRRFTPAAVRFLHSERQADCSRAVTELGYRPTDIAAAIEDAYACFVRRGLIDRPTRTSLTARSTRRLVPAGSRP